MATSTSSAAKKRDAERSGDEPAASGITQPRIIEEHEVGGRPGEEEIDATDELGRRWYRLRPEPRRRADLIGFNYIWWFVLWMLILLIVLPWGSNWGW